MSGALVKAGTTEPVVVNVTVEDELPTSVQVRAFIEELGIRKYDNGTMFTTTDTLLSGTFVAPVWRTTYTWPTYAIGKVVHIEAKPIGLSKDLTMTKSRLVVGALTDDIVDDIELHEEGGYHAGF